MPGFVSIGGVEVKIDPSPDKLPAPSPGDQPKTGDVKVICRNFSCIAADCSLQGISSDDPNVASVRGTKGAKVHVSARPPHSTMAHPASASGSVATWQPHAKGVTTLRGIFQLNTNASVLGTVQPDAEVEST